MRTVTIGGVEQRAHWSAYTTIVYSEAFHVKGEINSGDASQDVGSAFNVAATQSGTVPAMTALKLAWAEVKTVNGSTPDFAKWVEAHPSIFEDADLTGQSGWAWEVVMEAVSCLFPEVRDALVGAEAAGAPDASDIGVAGGDNGQAGSD